MQKDLRSRLKYSEGKRCFMLVDLAGKGLKENFKLESGNVLISKEKKN
ncbi:MAG: hypothetical protein WB014_02550 [Methanosarcina sp.]